MTEKEFVDKLEEAIEAKIFDHSRWDSKGNEHWLTRVDEGGDEFHGGGFTRAIRSQVAGNFAASRLETDTVDGGDSGESLGHVAQFEHRRG